MDKVKITRWRRWRLPFTRRWRVTWRLEWNPAARRIGQRVGRWEWFVYPDVPLEQYSGRTCVWPGVALQWIVSDFQPAGWRERIQEG